MSKTADVCMIQNNRKPMSSFTGVILLLYILLCHSVSVQGEVFDSSLSTLQSLDNHPINIRGHFSSFSSHRKRQIFKKSWFQTLRGGDDDFNNNKSNKDCDDVVNSVASHNNNNDDDDDAVEGSVVVKEGEILSSQEQTKGIEGEEMEQDNSFWKVALDETFPSPLRNRVQCISLPKFNVDIFILGTAHISRDSAHDASWIMQHLRPDCLFVELCHQRTGLLLPPSLQQSSSSNNNQDSQEKSSTNSKEQKKHDKSNSDDFPRTAALSSTLLTKIQSDYASKLNVTIGGEFHAAYECAAQQQKEYERMMHWEYYYRQSSLSLGRVHNTHNQEQNNKNGCVVVLGDRPVKLTLLRAWESLRLWGKMKLVLALLWSSLRQPSMEDLKKWMDTIMNDPNSDLLTKSIEEMKTHFPSMERVIIQERDKYMTLKLYQTARILSSFAPPSFNQNNNIIPKKKIIVAIVGAGHCGGMLQHFGDILSSEPQSNEEEEIAHQQALALLVETKRYKVDTNEFVKSLTSDITQLQYPG